MSEGNLATQIKALKAQFEVMEALVRAPRTGVPHSFSDLRAWLLDEAQTPTEQLDQFIGAADPADAPQ